MIRNKVTDKEHVVDVMHILTFNFYPRYVTTLYIVAKDRDGGRYDSTTRFLGFREQEVARTFGLLRSFRNLVSFREP